MLPRYADDILENSSYSTTASFARKVIDFILFDDDNDDGWSACVCICECIKRVCVCVCVKNARLSKIQRLFCLKPLEDTCKLPLYKFFLL